MSLRFLLASLPLLTLALPAAADPASPATDIVLDHGTVWQTISKATGTRGFIQIHNTGDTNETLTTPSCPDADTTSLRGADGKPITSLPVPAGKTVTLAPGGMYLQLDGLHFPVERGSILPCSFTFTGDGPLGGFLSATREPGA